MTGLHCWCLLAHSARLPCACRLHTDFQQSGGDTDAPQGVRSTRRAPSSSSCSTTTRAGRWPCPSTLVRQDLLPCGSDCYKAALCLHRQGTDGAQGATGSCSF